MGLYSTFTVFLVLCHLYCSQSSCYSNCNGRGTCDKYSSCTCMDGFFGADCSMKSCPSSFAWSDQAIAVDTAHQLAICSNRGICNTVTGTCECLSGFTGHACERLDCENDCNGNGKCMTMSDYAKRYRDSDSNSYSYSTVWDATKMMGCICDITYSGYDCSQKVCPTGDDPLTINQVNERQLIKCIATSGSFTLYFRGYASSTISHLANAATVQKALQTIPYLAAGINVTFSQIYGKACQAATNIIIIEFDQQFGPQPPIVAVPDKTMISTGGYVDISADGSTTFTDTSNKQYISIKGTKENADCSSRGICDVIDGYCNCFDTNGDVYGSSNGYGMPGIRGDCGAVLSSLNNAISSCPGEIQCSAHGICSDTTYECDCYTGWTAGDCSERSCPFGLSWFDYPVANNIAHSTYVECSNMGICSRETGQCQCREGFYGSSCEHMACNGVVETRLSQIIPCNGHGKCLSISELAIEATINGNIGNYTYGDDPNNAMTWDGSRIHGCLCDTGYEAFDCSLRSCPKGDDPGTYDDHAEVQIIKCIADEGSFTLSFRQETTVAIPYNSTKEYLYDVLTSLSTISSNVKVYFTHDQLFLPNQTLSHVQIPSKDTVGIFNANGSLLNPTSTDSITHSSSPICNTTDNTQLVIIEFIGTYGNLPKLTTDVSNLFLSSTGENGIVTIYSDGQSVEGTFYSGQSYTFTSIEGTTENVECNNRGICDYSTGLCDCFPQWSSSDGDGGPGSLGDCGYRIQN